jgi:hypothetical protein
VRLLDFVFFISCLRYRCIAFSLWLTLSKKPLKPSSEGRIKYCPHCLEYGFHHKLGLKIKKKDEPPAPHDDQFMSCYQCGNTFGIYETFTESKIKDSLETTDNPFEGNESTFLSTDSRATQRRKGKKPRSKRLKTEEHEDSEIQAEENKGYTVRILQDT